ncbi:MAG TPA: zinc metallopeptidase [bacterium]|nr:zinc metallopeptidase [bacterium]
MFWPLWDPTMIIVIPALLFALYAQFRVKSTFARWSEVRIANGRTGAEIAREILRRNGLSEVEIDRTDGMLSDHYDPRTRTLSLSSDVHDGISVSSAGVAAHETGHAIQHARDYAPLALRSAMVPTVQFGSWLAWPLFFVGLIFHSGAMIQIGILIFTVAVAFTIVTLPVEFDASARAMRALREEGLVTADELGGVRAVLTAAALTYVAAAAMAVLQLVRMLLLARREE